MKMLKSVIDRASLISIFMKTRAFFLEKEVPKLTRGEWTNIRKAL
jgi:hypothetical protein